MFLLTAGLQAHLEARILDAQPPLALLLRPEILEDVRHALEDHGVWRELHLLPRAARPRGRRSTRAHVQRRAEACALSCNPTAPVLARGAPAHGVNSSGVHGVNGSGGIHRIAEELEGGEVGKAVEPHRDPPQVIVVEPQLRGVARVSATESHALCILSRKSSHVGRSSHRTSPQ